LNQNEAEQFIRKSFHPTVQQLIIAKAFLAKNVIGNNPAALLTTFLAYMKLSCPSQITSNQQTDPVPALRQLAEWLSWRSACGEAIWALVRSGILIINGALVDGRAKSPVDRRIPTQWKRVWVSPR
jgi:hypothetical protein